MPILYPGLYNSSYVPAPLELKFANNPGGYLTPYLFAVMFSFLIAGVILSQATTYYNSKFFTEDSLSLRIHVAVVLVLSALKLVQVGAAGVRTPRHGKTPPFSAACFHRVTQRTRTCIDTILYSI
ncbi:hypothetical protein EXIGLDRAFT_733592 [Exidia glandulosa HHB12029]|uniref:Uncharacterized protein n=1 Tax=Exidia glandulosa HHB12029 TaxID=1314781 RepID=A0A165KEX3_EXIGL|nr:hypothetical protein EXIGLDRAFT_733592 [Exidia glandulosa HHB12029]